MYALGAGCGPGQVQAPSAPPGARLPAGAPGTPVLTTWVPPPGMASSKTFSVKVKQSGGSVWQDLFVHEVKVGHQQQAQPPLVLRDHGVCPGIIAAFLHDPEARRSAQGRRAR